MQNFSSRGLHVQTMPEHSLCIEEVKSVMCGGLSMHT
jgi:hypothetical protein